MLATLGLYTRARGAAMHASIDQAASDDNPASAAIRFQLY
jgi:hypothetical protein